MSNDELWEKPYRNQIANCRDCQGPIVWLKTFAGKNIAVEVDEVEDNSEVYDKKKHKCHWDNCEAKR